MSLYGSIVVKQHILPQLLFNLDETPMTFTDLYKYSEIMMEDGQLPAAVIPERMANVTILLTIPAVGTRLPTVILWPAKTVPEELQVLRAYDILVYPNQSGWQTITSFEFIMLKIILPAIVNKRKFLNLTDQTALLVLDSHSSRFTSRVWKECATNNIIAITIPSHTSHFLQPLDCGPNGIMKKVCFYQIIHELNPPAEIKTAPGLLVPPGSPRTKKQFIKSQPRKSDCSSSSTANDNLAHIKAWKSITDWINRLSRIRTAHLSFHPYAIQTRPPTIASQLQSQQTHDTTPSEPDLSDAIGLRGGYKHKNKPGPTSSDEDYQPPPEERSDASRRRSLFVHAFPIALDRATDKASIQSAWKISGLYPLNSAVVQPHLHPGPPYRTAARDLPLIAGKVLTDSTMISATEQTEQKRNLKLLEKEKRKATAEKSQAASHARCQKALEELEKSMEYGPSASFWIPQFEQTIQKASTAAADKIKATVSPDADIVTVPDSTSPYGTELHNNPDLVVLPAFDYSKSEKSMDDQTMD